MKIKEILNDCRIRYIDIVLFSYTHKPNYSVEKTNIKIRSRTGFSEFIDTYGESDVCEWSIESVDGVVYMLFDLDVKDVDTTIY